MAGNCPVRPRGRRTSRQRGRRLSAGMAQYGPGSRRGSRAVMDSGLATADVGGRDRRSVALHPAWRGAGGPHGTSGRLGDCFCLAG